MQQYRKVFRIYYQVSKCYLHLNYNYVKLCKSARCLEISSKQIWMHSSDLLGQYECECFGFFLFYFCFCCQDAISNSLFFTEVGMLLDYPKRVSNCISQGSPERQNQNDTVRKREGETRGEYLGESEKSRPGNLQARGPQMPAHGSIQAQSPLTKEVEDGISVQGHGLRAWAVIGVSPRVQRMKSLKYCCPRQRRSVSQLQRCKGNPLLCGYGLDKCSQKPMC